MYDALLPLILRHVRRVEAGNPALRTKIRGDTLTNMCGGGGGGGGGGGSGSGSSGGGGSGGGGSGPRRGLRQWQGRRLAS